ncbi:MAG TPA: PASTA domain-containing protein [Frankiaceae bacterium]|nr:PASTA domain-containing protein [Frankiaceae bacterium]
MAKGWTPWRDGRRAWSRLESWGPGDPSARSGHENDGEGALRALSDIGLVRRLLDQAELVAVRTSRRHGKSWAEIATRLGVTRQSAWERWRELDELPAVDEGRSGARVTRVIAEAATELSGEAAGELRRRATVRVPSVIGRSWDDAREMLLARQLVAVGPDPDGPPLAMLGWPDGIVVDQSPESGARVPPGSLVRLWLEAGGGGDAGVREPRRPSPDPKSARVMREEPSDEAVG